MTPRGHRIRQWLNSQEFSRFGVDAPSAEFLRIQLRFRRYFSMPLCVLRAVR